MSSRFFKQKDFCHIKLLGSLIEATVYFYNQESLYTCWQHGQFCSTYSSPILPSEYTGRYSRAHLDHRVHHHHSELLVSLSTDHNSAQPQLKIWDLPGTSAADALEKQNEAMLFPNISGKISHISILYGRSSTTPHSPCIVKQVEVNPDLTLSEILKDKTGNGLIGRSSALPTAWLLPSFTMPPVKCCPAATEKQQLHDCCTSLTRQFVHVPQSCSALFYCYQLRCSRGDSA